MSELDIARTCAPKTDQLNADALLGGSMTIKVTDITIVDSKDQPVSIFYDGCEGKPYKPCLSMRRMLVRVWGPDGKAWFGRSMTLFHDEKVRLSGAEVGGIRISHVSNISAPVTMALTEKRGSKKPYTVRPLVIATDLPAVSDEDSKHLLAEIAKASNGDELCAAGDAALEKATKHKDREAYRTFSAAIKEQSSKIAATEGEVA